jgi:two-component system invasion response regulator UvrY
MIRIGIVDDHAIVRTGLRQFLSEHVDLRVTGEGASGHDALEMARGGEVDVLLLDISMPDQSGVDALAAIKARFPELPVLILSGFPEAHYATTLLRQGASGYLNKECDPDEIANAIRLVARGRRYISPAVAEQLADSVVGGGSGGNAPDKPQHEALSERSSRSSCGWRRARPWATSPRRCSSASRPSAPTARACSRSSSWRPTVI